MMFFVDIFQGLLMGLLLPMSHMLGAKVEKSLRMPLNWWQEHLNPATPTTTSSLHWSWNERAEKSLANFGLAWSQMQNMTNFSLNPVSGNQGLPGSRGRGHFLSHLCDKKWQGLLEQEFCRVPHPQLQGNNAQCSALQGIDSFSPKCPARIATSFVRGHHSPVSIRPLHTSVFHYNLETHKYTLYK